MTITDLLQTVSTTARRSGRRLAGLRHTRPSRPTRGQLSGIVRPPRRPAGLRAPRLTAPSLTLSPHARHAVRLVVLAAAMSTLTPGQSHGWLPALGIVVLAVESFGWRAMPAVASLTAWSLTVTVDGIGVAHAVGVAATTVAAVTLTLLALSQVGFGAGLPWRRWADRTLAAAAVAGVAAITPPQVLGDTSPTMTATMAGCAAIAAMVAATSHPRQSWRTTAAGIMGVTGVGIIAFGTASMVPAVWLAVPTAVAAAVLPTRFSQWVPLAVMAGAVPALGQPDLIITWSVASATVVGLLVLWLTGSARQQVQAAQQTARDSQDEVALARVIAGVSATLITDAEVDGGQVAASEALAAIAGHVGAAGAQLWVRLDDGDQPLPVYSHGVGEDVDVDAVIDLIAGPIAHLPVVTETLEDSVTDQQFGAVTALVVDDPTRAWLLLWWPQEPAPLGRLVAEQIRMGGDGLLGLWGRMVAAEQLRRSERSYRLLVDHSTDMTSRHAVDGRLLWASPASTTLLGRDPDDAVGLMPTELLHPDDLDDVAAMSAAALRNGNVGRVKFRVNVAGRWRWCEATITRMTDGPAVQLHCVTRDISDRVAAEQARAEAEKRFRVAFESAPTGHVITDAAGVIVSANATMVALCDTDGLRGRSVTSLLAGEDAATAINGALRDGGVRQVDAELTDRPGIWVASSFAAVQPEDGRSPYLVGQFLDVTHRRQTADELAHAATHDQLTGLPNRQLISDRLDHALARSDRSGTPVGVIFADLDGFKQINDTHGHEAGDRVLQAVADRLAEVVRGADTAGRLGGDEFVVVCEELADEEAGAVLAQRLADAVCQPVDLGAVTVTPGISIGVAIGEPGTDADRLLRRADAAMYAVKHASSH